MSVSRPRYRRVPALTVAERTTRRLTGRSPEPTYDEVCLSCGAPWEGVRYGPYSELDQQDHKAQRYYAKCCGAIWAGRGWSPRD